MTGTRLGLPGRNFRGAMGSGAFAMSLGLRSCSVWSCRVELGCENEEAAAQPGHHRMICSHLTAPLSGDRRSQSLDHSCAAAATVPQLVTYRMAPPGIVGGTSTFNFGCFHEYI